MFIAALRELLSEVQTTAQVIHSINIVSPMKFVDELEKLLYLIISCIEDSGDLIRDVGLMKRIFKIWDHAGF